jgi:hypothetical protein
MQDFRLVAARRLTWNKDAWREPAFVALAIRGLQQIVADETESPESQAEAKMLIEKLYLARKVPALT